MVQFNFAVSPDKPASVNYAIFPISSSKTVDIDAGLISKLILLPAGITLPYKLFVVADWNTMCAVVKAADSFEVFFSVPAPADSKLRWGMVPL
jgi:hypothetical protein